MSNTVTPTTIDISLAPSIFAGDIANKEAIAGQPLNSRESDGNSRDAKTLTQAGAQVQNPRRGKRRPMSAEQRAKLSAAQRAYIANDPRWSEHRRKLAAAQEARRMTLIENEVAAILEMRRKGRTFSYISEEIGVCRDVIGRELKALGIATTHVRSGRRARRGRGFWRCFD